jgi:predicted HicB family RNase H-like nuclease
MPDMKAKVLTLRLLPEAHDRATALAERRGLSLNRLFQEKLVLLDQC